MQMSEKTVFKITGGIFTFGVMGLLSVGISWGVYVTTVSQIKKSVEELQDIVTREVEMRRSLDARISSLERVYIGDANRGLEGLRR